MREIKFRAYDKERKEFLSCGQILIAIKSGANPKESPQYLDILKDADMFKDRFEIMQYTGLKDDNGREIYDGDILQILDIYGIYKGYIDWWGDRWVVMYKISESKELQRQSLITTAMNRQIIGNIYENPDLLEGV